MSFSAQWLALREPYGLRARNADVRDAVAASFKGAPSLRIVDLACGTGWTLRALSPHSRRINIGVWPITTSACWRVPRKPRIPRASRLAPSRSI